MLLLGLLIATTGASPPEIIRVHVPSAAAGDWFPAGTAVRRLSAERFESLLDAATRAVPPEGFAPAPRLIRARHRARWNAGVLHGESRLAVSVPGERRASLVLEPWTPMAHPIADRQALVGTNLAGQTVLRVEPPAASPGVQRDVVLSWDLRARPGSDGRSFALGLPGEDTTELTLEVPVGLVPMGPAGFREGPLPCATEGFRSWRFHGKPALTNLHLIPSLRPSSPREQSLVWVNGPTRIFLGAPVAGNLAPANWRTDWTVQTDRRGPIQLSAELSPGLELIGVSGPTVKDFQSERTGAGTRVRVSLAAVSGTPSMVTFEAHARAPLEGLWTVPAIQPLDAVWTGGTTAVSVDPLRIIEDCRERAGRRVPSQGSEPASAGAIIFESSSPEPVADLVFRQSSAVPPCLVRGRLLVGTSAPAMECELSGLGGSISGRELDIDLPATWTPGRVRYGGLDDAISWQPTIQADGSTRLHILIPGGEAAPQGQTLQISASATAPNGRGPLVLPRARPLGMVVSDESWVATAEESTTLRPIAAHGLAWLDPPPAKETEDSAAVPGPDSRPALAWRWTGELASATVEIDQVDQDPRVEISYRARIEQDGSHLALAGQITVKPGSRPLDVLPIWINSPSSGSVAWTFRAGRDRSTLAAEPLDQPVRSLLGLPEAGLAWGVRLGSPVDVPTRLEFEARLPWNHGGPVPLLSAPRTLLPRTTVLVQVPVHMRLAVKTAGLRRLEPGYAERVADLRRQEAGPRPERPPAAPGRSDLTACAFTFTEPGGALELSTEPLEEHPRAGVIRDAYLTTVLHTSGVWLNRLRITLHAEQFADLRFDMPPDSRLIAAQLDGTAVTPVVHGTSLSIALQRNASGLRYKTVDLDYETNGKTVASGSAIRPAVPRLGLPCLSFSWELITQPHWKLTATSTGMLCGDRASGPGWPFGMLGIPEWRWLDRTPSTRLVGEEVYRRLDEMLAGAPPGELTVAEWFTRWDSAATPLLVDRLALSAAGLGPRARCNPIRAAAGGRPAAVLTLEQFGLALLRFDSTLLITSQTAASAGAGRFLEPGRE